MKINNPTYDPIITNLWNNIEIRQTVASYFTQENNMQDLISQCLRENQDTTDIEVKQEENFGNIYIKLKN